MKALLSTGEAKPQILCPVLDPSLQERHWGAGEGPEKGNRTGEGSGGQDQGEAAEGDGDVYPGEKEAQAERPYCSLQLPERRL